MVTFKGIMYLLQSLFSQTMKVRAPSNQKILGAIEGPELPLLGMVISFYFLIFLYRTIYWDLLIFSIWLFIETLSWNFSILRFLGTFLLGHLYLNFVWKVFIGTLYGYFFIGTFPTVAFILDLLSVLFLGLFSSMGFFPLFPVNSFDFWEVVFPETE